MSLVVGQRETGQLENAERAMGGLCQRGELRTWCSERLAWAKGEAAAQLSGVQWRMSMMKPRRGSTDEAGAGTREWQLRRDSTERARGSLAAGGRVRPFLRVVQGRASQWLGLGSKEDKRRRHRRSWKTMQHERWSGAESARPMAAPVALS